MSGRRLDVLCAGEALVDFLPEGKGKRVRDVERWTRCSGGSPANVAIGLARLGVRSGFLGVVGEDEFGHFLKSSLTREGVDTRWMRQTKEARTGLAFVSIADDGDRSFVFYRKPSAEFLLAPSDARAPALEEVGILHFGSNSLLLPDAQDAMRELVRRARQAGCLVSCDPNLRLHVWDEPG
ncbi:MAG: carbohydrate kinase family protein, partial [Myxococcales bacterium]